MSVCAIAECQEGACAKGFCRPHYKQNWYLRNRERLRLRMKERYHANPDANRAYREANRERRSAQAREWRERNDEHRRVYNEARREERAAYNRIWAEGNRERVAAKSRRWAERHPEKMRERWRVAGHQRRAIGRLTAEGRAYLEVLRGDPCSYCGGVTDSVDHIEPVTVGGANVWENLTAACASCNSRKGAKPLLQFLLDEAM